MTLLRMFLTFCSVAILATGPAWAQVQQTEFDKTWELKFRDFQAGRDDPRNIRQTDICDPVVELHGAQPAPLCAFSDLVRITYVPKENYPPLTCTGVLVSPTQVLTAAHCSCGILGTYRFYLNRLRREFGLANSTERPNLVYDLAWAPQRYANYSCELDASLQPGRDLALMSIAARGDTDAAPGSAEEISNALESLVQDIIDALEGLEAARPAASAPKLSELASKGSLLNVLELCAAIQEYDAGNCEADDPNICTSLPRFQRSCETQRILEIFQGQRVFIKERLEGRLANIASMHEVARDAETIKLVAAGYGRTEFGTLPTELRYAAIPIEDWFCSKGRFAGSRCEVLREFVLADLSGIGTGVRPDSCGGDSGAPIFWQPPEEWLATPLDDATVLDELRARVLLVGITSRAVRGVRHSPGTLCGGGGLYTAVGHPDVINWLRSHGVNPWTRYDVGLRP